MNERTREPGQTRVELVGQHIVGRAAEALVSPAGVRRAGREPMAEAAEERQMGVADARRAEPGAHVSRLNFQLCQERGTVRTSASTAT
jgi:hypothetical protein